MAKTFPATARLRDTLYFNLFFVIPTLLQGLFVRRRLGVAIVSLFRANTSASTLARRWRRIYGNEGVLIRMGFRKHYLLLNERDIRTVLENSPLVFADASSKRRGMLHFQPNAVTISRGTSWMKRRKWNEEMLDSAWKLVDTRARHREIVAEEFSRIIQSSSGKIRWAELHSLCERIALRIIFGHIDNHTLTISRDLTRLMRWANIPILPRRKRLLNRLLARIHDSFERAPDDSLVGGARIYPASVDVSVEHQVPHWLFAMRDTLAENLSRTLVVLFSDDAIGETARASYTSEMAPSDATSYLTACLSETMRLWPTTPFIVRAPLHAYPLTGLQVGPMRPVVIANELLHRDGALLKAPDLFRPERWYDNSCSWTINHFSNGAQICPGADLALQIGTDILGEFLSQSQMKLISPRVDLSEKLPLSLNPFSLSIRSMM